MADQVELTGSAVTERLRMETIPKRVNDDGSVDYYLWAITDKILHEFLTDALYGEFRDASDDLHSITLPGQRRKGAWLFAPSMDLIDWFADASADSTNTKADHKNHLKMAYVKMGQVEERLDEGQAPVVKELLHPTGDKKLYTYSLQDLMMVNNFALNLLQQDNTISEIELLEAMDRRIEDERAKTALYTQPIDLSEEDVDDVDEDDEGIALDEVVTGTGRDNDDDDAAAFFGETDADGFGAFEDGYAIEDLDEETPEALFDEEPAVEPLAAAVEPEEGGATRPRPVSADGDELPTPLQHMLQQIKTPVIKAPTVHADNSGLDGYYEQVNSVREQLNAQLKDLAESARQRLISEYYEKHSLAESQIDARLDPEQGDPNVVSAYSVVKKYNEQDIADADALEQQKRQELEAQTDTFHAQYMKEVVAKAEKEWQVIKDTKYVEEPIQSWREGITATVDVQHNERLRRFNEWRDRIKSQYLTQVDAPILKGISHEVKGIVDQLQLEQTSARQELTRSEDRLFNKSLELEKIDLQKAAAQAAPVGEKSVTTPDNDLDELDLELADEPIEPNVADDGDTVVDEDYLVDEDEAVSEADEDRLDAFAADADEFSESDVLSAAGLGDDDELNLDDLDVDLADDDGETAVDLNDIDYGDAVIDDIPGFGDDREATGAQRPAEPSGDNYGDEAVDVDDVFDDLDLDIEEEDEDDAESIAPTPSKKLSLKPKGKKASKGKGNGDKPKKSLLPKGDGKLSKKMMALIGGVGVLVIAVIITVVMMFAGNGSSNLTVSPSATNTYVKGNMLSAKQDGKNVALVIQEVNGNKLKVMDVANNKVYTIDKPSSK